MGCAAVPCCGAFALPPKSDPNPLYWSLASMAEVDGTPFPEVVCRADVRLEVCGGLRGESCPEAVATSIGLERLSISMLPDGSLKSGKVESSKSESKRVEST